MDGLMVAPEEWVLVPGRNNKRIRVTSHKYDALVLLREHLKKVARSGETVTYKEAAAVTNAAYLQRGLGRMLDVLIMDWHRRGEPSLAALVVRADSGDVGEAFLGDAVAERRLCYRYWGSRSR